MATFRTCWDSPYRFHHQQLVQPRQSPWGLPGQRRSMGVRPYDPPQSRQPSCWEPPPRRALRGYSDYDQPPQPPHLREPPSRLKMPHQHTYRQPSHSTRMERYEQLIDLLDAATSRLESHFEEIDRRLTKLQSSKSAYEQHPYADFDFKPPRHRPTCLDPPSQMSGHRRRVGEIRAPPLPEPPPQPTPDVLYQYLQTWNKHPTHPSSRTPTRLQFVLDQKPPPSHRCSAVPPLAAAAAPPPPLRSDRLLKQPSITSTIELSPYPAPSPC